MFSKYSTCNSFFKGLRNIGAFSIFLGTRNPKVFSYFQVNPSTVNPSTFASSNFKQKSLK